MHHRGVLALGDHAADGVAVPCVEVAVQHDGVVGVEVQLCRRLEAVVGDINGHLFVLHSLDERVSEGARVLNDEDPHADAPAAVLTARGRESATLPPPRLTG
jgi:hypothetical protein